ncbi:hypothetical protein [Marinitoga sp. 38H-ov]|uniref:hypothetical protein n=1 Tax=Marinitoga sp. 38H-ov TaxID=1755814 RepID=UPI0013EA7517|nr:hypothetical protein [Marinitoga sp. 38H-ov]KAF2955713.1 hypothetical protein AS160_00965 [Marinitoga sp. 38H-ov]
MYLLKRLFVKFFLVLFFLISINSFSQIIYNISDDSYVENTKYFKFVFEKDLRFYVNELKYTADKLYEDYSKFYDTIPGTITVYIFDDVDYVNSFAIPPLNVIRLYINPPYAKQGLSNHVEDWISFVFSHELNHIFYGNTLNNFVSWIPNEYIKKVLMMNWNPSYLHEGLSIYMESKYYNGRFNNDIFNMYLKAEILSKYYPRYSLEMGKDIWSPAGFNYMYGAILTKEISEKYGEEILKKIIKDINSHLFFSTISSSFERITNEKWNDFLLYIKIKYKNQYLKEYEDYQAIYDTSNFTSNLKTDGKYLYYYNDSPSKIKGVYKNNELILPGISKFDVSNDGKIIYLISNQNTNTLYLKCNCPISDTVIDNRVINFAFVGNDKIVYSKINNGLTAIFLKNINNGNIEKLIDYGKYTINDFYYYNNKIFFSGTLNNQNDIYYIDLNSKELIQLTNDKYIELNLFIKNNNIYYSSNYEDNIFNIYSLNLSSNLVKKLTNHIFGTFYPIILNNELYFLYYDSNGYHLSKTDIVARSEEYLKIYNSKISIKNIKKDNSDSPKYFEPLKYNFLIPYSEDNEIGAIFLSLSEGLNYGLGIGVLSNLKPIFGYYLDYMGIQNYSIFKFDNNKLYTNFNFSKNFEFYLKNKNYFGIEGNIKLENLNFVNKDLKIHLMKNPYEINDQNYYENNLIIGFINNYYYIQYSKAFDLYSVKNEPYIYYDTNGNLIPGINISKKIWYPYYSILDGKYGFDGIKANIDYNYNLKTKKSKMSFSLNFDLTAFYWINFSIPITNEYK